MTTCAVCRERPAFTRMYVYDNRMDGVFHSTRLRVCDRCASFDKLPKIRVRKSVSRANRAEGWPLKSPVFEVTGEVWGDLTTDEKILRVIEHYKYIHRSDIIKFSGVKRTTVYASIKRLVDTCKIEEGKKHHYPRGPDGCYRLARPIDTE